MDKLIDIFNNQLVYALGWTLIHSLWQCMLVFGLLSLFFILSKKIQPQVRYTLAICSLACCILISAKTFIVYYQEISIANQLYLQIQDSIQTSEQTVWHSVFEYINPWLDDIVLLWTLGFFFQGYRYVIDVIVTNKLTRQSVSSLPEQWEQKLQTLVERVEIKNLVTFLQSSKVKTPLVIGFIKPVILLPVGILTQLPEEQIKAIILHELAHIKRHDYLLNLFQCIVRVVFFFNPFVLAISRAIDIEREKACDDMAVKISGDPLTYARSLSSFAEISNNSQTAMAATKDQFYLLARVKRLFTKNHSLSQASEKVIALICVCTLGLTLSVNANSPLNAAPKIKSMGLDNQKQNVEPVTNTDSNSIDAANTQGLSTELLTLSPSKSKPTQQLMSYKETAQETQLIQPSVIKGVSQRKVNTPVLETAIKQEQNSYNTRKPIDIASNSNFSTIRPSALDYVKQNKQDDILVKQPVKKEVARQESQVEQKSSDEAQITTYKNLINRKTITEADQLFKEQKYQQAKDIYSSAAMLGSPHAFYQLGTIYHKGLAVSQDNISAHIWFSLAAEYDFSDSTQAAQNIYSLLSNQQQKKAKNLLLVIKNKLGQQRINKMYYPVINHKNINSEITFGGRGKFEYTYQDMDLILDNVTVGVVNNSFYEDISDIDSLLSISFGSSFKEYGQTGTLRTLKRFTGRTPFLIVDYDVGPDGSIRNVSPVQEIGYARSLYENFVMKTFPSPNFKGSRVNFVNRSYIGAANFSKYTMRDGNIKLYDKLRRVANRLKISPIQEDKYQYAMMLLTFKWLKQQNGEVDQLLKKLAEDNHPKAQYEYGAKLYREQTDIQQGIYWISEASKYGHTKAEYLLGTILHSSPWVVNDEKKSLFWYESAMNKGHLAAKLKAADLRMLATDPSLHNIDMANEYLISMQEQQRNNPEYYFLLAIAEKNRAGRDFQQVIEHVEKAISLGEKFNWDVSYWQGLVQKWTTGKVYIADS